MLITDRFEILGFGGEIAGRLPEIRSVRRALDLEGEESEEVLTLNCETSRCA